MSGCSIGHQLEVEIKRQGLRRERSVSTSTPVTSVGSVRHGINWMVCWTILASVEYDVTKRRPIEINQAGLAPDTFLSRRVRGETLRTG